MNSVKIIRGSGLEPSPSDFTEDSIANGLRFGAFDDLNPKVRKKLIRLLYRLNEKAYRRGVQHGVVLCPDNDTAVKLRFFRSLELSPRAEDANGAEAARDRLFMEYPVLRDIGLELN